MREPKKSELNNTNIVVLDNEELILLKNYHEKVIKPIQEKLKKLENKYMDIVKTDFYYKKKEELENSFYYHKSSLDLINSIIE